jgi:hypothetical protein
MCFKANRNSALKYKRAGFGEETSDGTRFQNRAYSTTKFGKTRVGEVIHTTGDATDDF